MMEEVVIWGQRETRSQRERERENLMLRSMPDAEMGRRATLRVLQITIYRLVLL